MKLLKLIPYSWRPKNIWYSLKCRFWHKYTTIKPRYLSNEWVDRDYLLVAVMFEVLSDFVEKEMRSAWGQSLNISNREEMIDLYNWWHRIKGNIEYEWDVTLDPDENFKRERIFNCDVHNKCKRLIDISLSMWT